jgi:hypothetical protein
MEYQLSWKNFLPSIVLLFFTPLILGFMALGHSQYALLGEMQDMQSASSNLPLAVAGTSTVFVLVFLAVNFVLGVSNLLVSRIYNFRFLNLVDLISLSIETVLETLYFIFALQGTVVPKGEETAIPLSLPINALAFALNLLLWIGFFVTFLLFVEKPYQVLKKKADERAKQEKAKEAEERALIQSELSSIHTVESLEAYLEKKKAAGEISEEQYQALLQELHDEDRS